MERGDDPHTLANEAENETGASIAASGLASGIIGFVLGLIIALTANSIALWARVIASSLDLLAVFIAWWGFKKTVQGKTDSFNYGFGKFESLISLIMAVLMGVSFLCISGAALIRFMEPVPIHGLGVIFGLGVHLVLGLINRRILAKTLKLEKRTKSTLVTAQRRLFTVKLGSNGLMFGSLGISYFFPDYSWVGYVDPTAAIIIAFTIVFSASKMFRFSVRDLLDCAIEERSHLLVLRALTHHFDDFEQVLEIRSRCSGGKVYVEVFLEFLPGIIHGTVMQTVQSLQTKIKKDIKCDEVLIIPSQRTDFGRNGGP